MRQAAGAAVGRFVNCTIVDFIHELEGQIHARVTNVREKYTRM